MSSDLRLLIRGEWCAGESRQPVLDKYTGEPVAELHVASTDQVGDAVADLVAGFADRPWPVATRVAALTAAARLLEARRDEFVESVMADTGFTRSDAQAEVQRGGATFTLSAEAAHRLEGELVPLDWPTTSPGRLAWTQHHPRGVVAAITPFNSPLNTVVHKLGPALAAGNPVVLKPAELTPRTANLIGEILLEAGVPDGYLAIVHGPGETVGRALLQDPRIAFYAFTGSTATGRIVARYAGTRPSQLELGSISPTIICADADLDATIPKIVRSAYRKAGQVCTSIQRLYVERSCFDQTVDALRVAIADVVAGDPRAPETDVGPLISMAAADRVEATIRDAVTGGASLLAGGARAGSVVQPALLVNARQDMAILSRELFGPAMSVLPFDDLNDAVADANDTPYGLAVGLFTNDLRRAMATTQTLRFGSVHINETSSSRLDAMPYGGVKESGTGVEGPLYAAREMSEQRLITLSY